VKSWNEFSAEEPELAEQGKRMLFRTREHVGLVFIATRRITDGQTVTVDGGAGTVELN